MLFQTRRLFLTETNYHVRFALPSLVSRHSWKNLRASLDGELDDIWRQLYE